MFMPMHRNRRRAVFKRGGQTLQKSHMPMSRGSSRWRKQGLEQDFIWPSSFPLQERLFDPVFSSVLLLPFCLPSSLKNAGLDGNSFYDTMAGGRWHNTPQRKAGLFQQGAILLFGSFTAICIEEHFQVNERSNLLQQTISVSCLWRWPFGSRRMLLSSALRRRHRPPGLLRKVYSKRTARTYQGVNIHL